MLTFPQDSQMQRLRAFVRTAATLHLFTNDIKPGPAMTAADFSEPDRSLGYRPIALHAASWRVEPSGAAVRAISAPAIWTFERGKAVVHGHYAVDADGTLLWAERFGDDEGGTWQDMPFEVLRPNDRLELVVVLDQEAEA